MLRLLGARVLPPRSPAVRSPRPTFECLPRSRYAKQRMLLNERAQSLQLAAAKLGADAHRRADSRSRKKYNQFKQAVYFLEKVRPLPPPPPCAPLKKTETAAHTLVVDTCPVPHLCLPRHGHGLSLAALSRIGCESRPPTRSAAATHSNGCARLCADSARPSSRSSGASAPPPPPPPTPLPRRATWPAACRRCSTLWPCTCHWALCQARGALLALTGTFTSCCTCSFRRRPPPS